MGGTFALVRGWRTAYSSSAISWRHWQATEDRRAAALRSQGFNTTDDARSTPKSSQHFGERQTMEKMNNLLSVFHSNDGALYVPSNPMATSLFYGFHGNYLLRAWRQPSTVHLSIVRCRIWGLGMLLRSSDELDDVREANNASRRTADEQLHQTLLRSPQKMANSRRQLCRALDTFASFRRWRTLRIYLGISLCDSQLDVVLILPPFWPNLESISC